MDWKRFYAAELAQPWGRRAVHEALAQQADGEGALRQALMEGAVASFPHVSLRDSAGPLARLVQSILATGRPRVVALGVLHGGTLPQPQRAAWAALNAGTPQSTAHAARFAGAFFERGATLTPFGAIEAGAWPAESSCLREDAALLAGEFSLDLFAAVLAAAAQARGIRPPALTRLFVCATRSPDGHYAVAQQLAGAIGALLGDDAVCVATGDLAHLGHGYMPADEVAALPTDLQALQALVQEGIRQQAEAAFVQQDLATAWAIGTRWRNDQRHILPVIAALLGPQARFELLSIGLSDYAAINSQPAPCLVASVLGLFRPPAHRGAA